MYAIKLHLTNKACLIVGGGQVAERKAKPLLQAGARLTVISPTLSNSLLDLNVHHIAEGYRTEHLMQVRPSLVIAATDQPHVNQQVAHDARVGGAWVNRADGSGESDFDNLPVLERAPLSVAVSTGGASPILARHLLNEIDQRYGVLYSSLATYLLELRPEVKVYLSSPAERHVFWERVLDHDLLTHLHTLPIDVATDSFKAWVAQHLTEVQP